MLCVALLAPPHPEPPGTSRTDTQTNCARWNRKWSLRTTRARAKTRARVHIVWYVRACVFVRVCVRAVSVPNMPKCKFSSALTAQYANVRHACYSVCNVQWKYVCVCVCCVSLAIKSSPSSCMNKPARELCMGGIMLCIKCAKWCTHTHQQVTYISRTRRRQCTTPPPQHKLWCAHALSRVLQVVSSERAYCMSWVHEVYTSAFITNRRVQRLTHILIRQHYPHTDTSHALDGICMWTCTYIYAIYVWDQEPNRFVRRA